MVPFIVLLVATPALRLLGAAGIDFLSTWEASVRGGLAAMLVLAASAHFSRRRTQLVAMVPPRLPAPHILVAIAGALELALAVSLLLPGVASPAALALIALLLVMFPANVRAARAGLSLGSKAVTQLPARTAMQALFIAAAAVAY